MGGVGDNDPCKDDSSRHLISLILLKCLLYNNIYSKLQSHQRFNPYKHPPSKFVRIVTSRAPSSSFSLSKRSTPPQRNTHHSGCMGMVCGTQLEACMTVDCSLLRLGVALTPLQAVQLPLGFQHQRRCFGPHQCSAGTYDLGVPGQYRYCSGCTRA
jgi:hypothetical protein